MVIISLLVISYGRTHGLVELNGGASHDTVLLLMSNFHVSVSRWLRSVDAHGAFVVASKFERFLLLVFNRLGIYGIVSVSFRLRSDGMVLPFVKLVRIEVG